MNYSEENVKRLPTQRTWQLHHGVFFKVSQRGGKAPQVEFGAVGITIEQAEQERADLDEAITKAKTWAAEGPDWQIIPDEENLPCPDGSVS